MNFGGKMDYLINQGKRHPRNGFYRLSTHGWNLLTQNDRLDMWIVQYDKYIITTTILKLLLNRFYATTVDV